MSNSRNPSRPLLTQWWIFAAAWLIHGLLLFYLFFTMVPEDVVSLWQRVAIVMAICFLLVVEIGFLALVNAGFEVLTRRIRRKRLLDAIKGTGLAVGLALLGASIFKFRAIGGHLETSDLWFAFANFRQLPAESKAREVADLLAVPLSTLVLAPLLFIELYRSRSTAIPGDAATCSTATAGAYGSYRRLAPNLPPAIFPPAHRLDYGGLIGGLNIHESRTRRSSAQGPIRPG